MYEICKHFSDVLPLYACLPSLMVDCPYFFYFHAKNSHKDKRKKLRDPLTKEELLECQCIYKNTRASYEKLYTNLFERYKEQINCIAETLELLKGRMSSFPETEKVEILDSCLKKVQSLSRGQITKIKEEFINLRKLLEEIKPLFAEKIYKFNITLSISCPANLFFYGDSLFTELVLINLLGKSVYRVPKNSKIVITIRKTIREIEIKIQDNGFSLNKVRRKLIKESFEFFIGANFFQQICQENGFIYESSRPRQGSNITKIIIPNMQPAEQKSNVIPLFRNRL